MIRRLLAKIRMYIGLGFMLALVAAISLGGGYLGLFLYENYGVLAVLAGLGVIFLIAKIFDWQDANPAEVDFD